MAAEGMQFPGLWDGGTMSTNLDGIWGMSVYNFARRLKTLKGLTPCEYICNIWTK